MTRRFIKYDAVAPGFRRLPVSNSLLVRFLFAACILVACAGSSRPNVVLIYTDDHVQWAVGAYGNRDVHTPHIDRLAADGMPFTRGFTEAVCSPSRAMVLTGLYSHRVGIPDFIPHGNPVVSGNGLPPGRPRSPLCLRRQGIAPD